MFRVSLGSFGLAVAFSLLSATLVAAQDDPYLERARRLQELYPLVDGHNDLPWQFRNRNYDMTTLPLTQDLTSLGLHTDIPRLREGRVGAQFWSVYVSCQHQYKDAVRATLEQIDNVYNMVDLYPDDFEIVTTADELENAFYSGKIASLIGVEGGHQIDSSMGALRMLYKLGARYMTITHSCSTPWSDARPVVPVHGGLTDFGVAVVHEMNRLGMLVDISHTHPNVTMQRTLEVAKAPVIFSHNCAGGVTDSDAAAPDHVLEMLAVNGGVMMITFVPGCVGTAVPTASDLANHIDHVRMVAGIDHVGIGSDYDGFSNPSIEMSDVSKFPVLTAELLRRGYSDEDVRKVIGGNVIRVMREVEEIARELQRQGVRPADDYLTHDSECRIPLGQDRVFWSDEDAFYN